MTGPAGQRAAAEWSARVPRRAGDIVEPRGTSAPVDDAIEFMWERFRRPLTLQDVAASARLSRFHFIRVFKQETRLTPGQFLSAIRLYEAKRLILSTTQSITDVSLAVGYNSLGSFTSSFTASVGTSPGRLRRLSRAGELGHASVSPDAERQGLGSVAGTITPPMGAGNARVFVGAFPTPLARHPCVASVVVDVPSGRPCCYSLPGVPDGTWYLIAVGLAEGLQPDSAGLGLSAVVGVHDRVSVSGGVVVSAALRLRHRRPVDPPPLLPLPDLQPKPFVASGTGCASLGTARTSAAGLA